jgi:hypothetical protein
MFSGEAEALKKEKADLGYGCDALQGVGGCEGGRGAGHLACPEGWEDFRPHSPRVASYVIKIWLLCHPFSARIEA